MGNLIVKALTAVGQLPLWSMADWDLLLRQANSTRLLGRLAALASDAGVLDAVPAAARYHLEAAQTLVAAQQRAVRREVEHIRRALRQVPGEVILLKGAAYLVAGLPAAKGRLFSDVDILVPRQALPEVEADLMQNGWATSHHHPYDQRYYRLWMHELPPMRHIRRDTVIDVHHAIVPCTATRLKPDSATIIEAAVPVPGAPGLRVLAATDMVLHSAAHLFYNEEFSHGLRDLSDLDLLLRHHGIEPGFWPNLLQRSRLLHLDRPLYYCLRHAARMFRTPIPEFVLEATASAGPPRLARAPMDSLWNAVLRPRQAGALRPLDALAGGLLYLRAHWERMPAHLLAYHALHKLLRARSDAAAGDPQPRA